MPKKTTLLIRLCGVGIGVGIASLLNLGILFWIIFGIVGWIYVGPYLQKHLVK